MKISFCLFFLCVIESIIWAQGSLMSPRELSGEHGSSLQQYISRQAESLRVAEAKDRRDDFPLDPPPSKIDHCDCQSLLSERNRTEALQLIQEAAGRVNKTLTIEQTIGLICGPGERKKEKEAGKKKTKEDEEREDGRKISLLTTQEADCDPKVKRMELVLSCPPIPPCTPGSGPKKDTSPFITSDIAAICVTGLIVSLLLFFLACVLGALEKELYQVRAELEAAKRDLEETQVEILLMDGNDEEDDENEEEDNENEDDDDDNEVIVQECAHIPSSVEISSKMQENLPPAPPPRLSINKGLSSSSSTSLPSTCVSSVIKDEEEDDEEKQDSPIFPPLGSCPALEPSSPLTTTGSVSLPTRTILDEFAELKELPIFDWLSSNSRENETAHWVPSETVLFCMCCDEGFSFWIRKHHCRDCGYVVCDSCSLGRKVLPHRNLRDPVRVCTKCFFKTEE